MRFGMLVETLSSSALSANAQTVAETLKIVPPAVRVTPPVTAEQQAGKDKLHTHAQHKYHPVLELFRIVLPSNCAHHS
jgi:hypothetical protein